MGLEYKKLTILVDMDDVLENLVECWVNFLSIKHGLNVTENDITNWKIANFFPTLSEEEIFEPLNNPDFWLSLSAMQNAPDVIKQLIDEGHKVKIVTASHANSVAPKWACIKKLYPYFKWEDVIIASDKSIIKGSVMIDDGTHNLEDFPGVRVLFDRPHNHNYDEKKRNMIRVRSWDEIIGLIHGLAY